MRKTRTASSSTNKSKPRKSGQLTRVGNKNRITYEEPAYVYCQQVLDGTIPASEALVAQCQKNFDDFNNMHEPNFPYIFNTEKADRIIKYSSRLIMTEGEYAGKNWQPILWQQWYLRSLMGWVRKEDNYRRYRRTFLLTSKGSGKKLVSSALLLYLTGSDGEMNAQVFAVANTLMQCYVVFKYCVDLIESTPMLKKNLVYWGGRIKPTHILYERGNNKSVATTMSTTSQAPSGHLPSAVLFDEYHEAKDDEMLNLLTAGYKNRTQPLTVITTNRHKDDESACGSEFRRAYRIAMGEEEDEKYFPALYYNVMEDDVFEDESRWLASNPSLPHVPKLEFIRDEVTKAKGTGGQTRAETYRLNFSIGDQDTSGWIRAYNWKKVEVEKLSETKPKEVYMGLDLSLTTDLTACAVIYEYMDHLEAEVKIWMPKERLREMQITDKQMYDVFVEEGYLEMCEGEVIDYVQVTDYLMEVINKHSVKALAFDNWGFRRIMEILQKNNIPYETNKRPQSKKMMLMLHPQGWTGSADKDSKLIHLSMPRSITRAEETILNEEIKVLYNPLLRIAMASAIPEMDNHNNRKFTKKNKRSKIDPIVALVMGIGVALEYRNTNRRVHKDASKLMFAYE